ncbi:MULTISPECIES: ABC-three component system middle component 5 [unclassified Sphingomonas]|jgi:hypothetical protein|uniref:ABC-three component system middle component 5 n=1 Tax=unclassified Sphingomonas TaxID=196159 RepID=UPI0008335301|nr:MULTISPECIES: ABC-three component system middle component 5 [unclassified Sphingomonas]
MISYQPALDRFHALFRMSCLLAAFPENYPIEAGKFRILDFYMVFPFRLKDFIFKQGQTGLKRVGRAYGYTQPYGGVPDDTALFLRMAPMQILAMDTLAAHDMIDREDYARDAIRLGDERAPPELAERTAAFIEEHGDLVSTLRTLAGEYAFLGEDGLKRRSGLMEYKYDVV